MTEPSDDPKKQPSPIPDVAGAVGAAATLARAAVNPDNAVGAARLAASSLLRAMNAIAQGSLDTAGEIAGQLNAGEPITEIVDGQVGQIRSAARSVLGGEDEPSTRSGRRHRSLREQGDDLINRSWSGARQANVQHPAFANILQEITPDEARILRFLAVAGAQPSIDIRTNTPFGVGSQRLGAGITFVADMAGCAWPDRYRHYLGNLGRLGLIRFSTEPVDDFRRYYLLDAHPDAVTAMKRAKRTLAIYRSIYLSVFGTQFCEECFTLDGYDAGGWADSSRGDLYWGKGPRLP